MTDPENNMYQEAAQHLIDYDATLVGEYNCSKPETIYAARCLYDEHGPFKLSWSRWRWDSPPSWYDGPERDHGDDDD